MIASFLTLGMIFRADIRVVQSYLEVAKIVIVAISVKFLSRNSRLPFIFACLCTCIILLPIQDVIIYDVSSLIGGYIIGIQKDETKKARNFMFFCGINLLLIIYEFVLVSFFTQINLFSMYDENITVILERISNCTITETVTKLFLGGFIFADCVFSSLVTFVLAQIMIKKVKRVLNVSS